MSTTVFDTIVEYRIDIVDDESGGAPIKTVVKFLLLLERTYGKSGCKT